MRILQIGDIHFNNKLSKTEKDKRKNCFESMFDFLEQCNEEKKIDYLVLSGDIAYHGAKDEYDEAYNFITELIQRTAIDVLNIIICPGNHDLDRDEMKMLDIPSEAKKIEKEYSFENLKKLSRPFENYINFCKRLGIVPAKCRVNGLTSYLIGVVSHEEVQFLILNSAWAAKDDSYNGRMFIGASFIESIIAEKLIDNNKVTMVVMHHPSSSLIDFERGNYNGSTNTFKKVQRLSNITVCGHTHEVELSINDEYSTPLAISGAAFIDNHYPNSISIYDINENVICPICYRYNDSNDDDSKWEPKYYEKITLRIPHEKGRRVLSKLCRRVLNISQNLNFDTLKTLKDDAIVKHIQSLSVRRKGMLSSFDKAILLLYCDAPEAIEAINIHYPKGDRSELKNYVDEVTLIPEYRKICMAISLSQLLGDSWKEIFDYIEKYSPVYYRHSIWGDTTNESFRENLRLQKDSKITQIKLMGAKYKLMESVFTSVHSVVSEMEIFLASPFLVKHNALMKIDRNYNAPIFFRGDYLVENDNSYKVDRIRRSLMIFYNIERLTKIHTLYNIPVTVFLFKDEYPGLGYQSIRNTGFAHIFPDCLPLSKPKFRFGVEVKERRIVEFIEDTLQSRIANEEIAVQKIILSEKTLLNLKREIQNDLAQYFLNVSISKETIEERLICLADAVEKDVDTLRVFLEECYELQKPTVC